MCTVSAVPTRDGFRVACNRDEQHSRPAASSPRRCNVGTRTALFPVDPVGGGTWIGVNDAGLTLALLNRNDKDHAQRHAGATRSRGIIIPSLLRHESIAEVLEAASTLDLAAYEPFHLCAITRTDVAFASSDGCELSTAWRPFVRPMMFTSSGLGDALVAGPRSKLFDGLVLAHERSWVEGQARFHAHRWPERPHLSVVMWRVDARTVSRSLIDVSAGAIQFHYEPLAALQPLPHSLSQ